MYRKSFPLLKKQNDLVYLDNAATTQKPDIVLDAIQSFYEDKNANVHRGLYPLATKATDTYEKARVTVAKFIGADTDEIIFVPGATEALNGLANSIFVSGLIDSEPRIVTSDLDHHSNLLPWQLMPNSELIFLGLNDDYSLEIPSNEQVETLNKQKPTDILTLPQISNVTGTSTPINKLIEMFKPAISILDATQSIAHRRIDVKELGIDALVFSAHKVYGPMGIGVLYIKKELQDSLSPFMFGGGMVSNVRKDSIELKESTEKFEAGTPNVAGAVGLAAALEYILSAGFDTVIEHEERLRKKAVDALKAIPDITIYHKDDSTSGPVISFTHASAHPHDIASYLGENNIAVRAGHHCTGPLHESLDIPASVRISFGLYNEVEEIDRFIEVLKEAIEIYSK